MIRIRLGCQRWNRGNGPAGNTPVGQHPEDHRRPTHARLNQLYLQELVAASAAFPLAFNAVRLTVGNVRFRLVDGDVADNIGIALMSDAH
jgi:hypothetical protein